ncbi:MAG: tetratricopeptide repeat protein [Nitrosomonas sp.]|nr:tetratricopeptide repeat protein [Nitrosomonas sp.]
MTPEDLLKQGDLNQALQLLQEQVKKQPSDSEHRIFLFQLLVVMGQWERALNQLAVIKELDDSAIAMVLMYRQVIACEQYREQVFGGKKEPIVLGKPEKWIALLIQSLKLIAEDKFDAADAMRKQAFEQASAIAGTIDDESFGWLADADERLGPIIEAFIDGRYLWTTLDNLNAIVIEEPADLRDVVWLPAHFSWKNGGENYGLIPTRYPFSYQVDPLLALSRKTVWQETAPDLYVGYGQKMIATDQSEYPLMQIRAINVTHAEMHDEGA